MSDTASANRVSYAPISPAFQMSLAAGAFGLFATISPIQQGLLPLHLEAIDSASRQANLALMTSLGAIFGLIANPLAGALSDRTHSALGRRRPWLLGGAILGALILLAMSLTNTVWLLVVAWCLFHIVWNASYAALLAILPDRVPAAQRGIVSAVVGLTFPLGALFAFVLIAQLSVSSSYLVLAALLFGGMMILVTTFREPPVRHTLPRVSPAAFLQSFWINPVKYPDFAWAWLSQFLTFTGYTLGTIFLLFFLQDAVAYEELFPGQRVAQGFATLQMIQTATLILAMIAGGLLSDRFRNRKVPLFVGSVGLAVSMLLFSFFPTWTVALAASAVLGLGFGLVAAVGIALMTEVLPAQDSSAKDMGVLNAARALPQVVAPGIAAFVVGQLGGYPVLFGFAAAFALLGGLVLMFIRSVR